MNIKVIVTNKVELTDGRRGPLMTPFDADIDFVIENISKGAKFKTGNKFLDIAFLEKVKLTAENSKKDLESKSEETKEEEIKTEGTIENSKKDLESKSEETKEEEIKTEGALENEEEKEEITNEEASTDVTEDVQADGTKNKKRNRNN